VGKPRGYSSRGVLRLGALLALLGLQSFIGPAQIVSHGGERRHAIALTFDAGADRGYALQILRTLERNHVRATFGMTGKWAQASGDLVRRMSRDGDQIVNHTYDHQSFTGLSTRTAPLTAAQRTWEIMQADRIIRSITGHSPRPFFRPPYGDYDTATLSLLSRLGYRYMVMWTVDSLGWAHLPASAILQRCETDVQPGAIFLMHVGSQSQDAFALQPFIAYVKLRGYSFVSVAQLLETS